MDNMDNVTVKDVVLDKKMSDYRFEPNDFLAGRELTVTITLGEYRRLVADVATAKAKIDKANDDKYTRDAENKTLKDENDKLKAELYELQKRLEKHGETIEPPTEPKEAE